MFDVVALGEILIDFAQKSKDADGYPTLVAQPGGAPANYLAALAKYGKKCAMIGKVGGDTFGRLLVNTLNKAEIDTHNVVVDDKFFTTLAFVTLNDEGDRRFSFSRKPGADTQITTEEIDFDALSGAKVFHFGTLSMTHEQSYQATMDCLKFARDNGILISYDPNLRLPLWKDEQTAKTAMLTGLAYADVVKISDEEVRFLFDCDEKQGADIILSQYYAKLVYVTMGAQGCYYSNGTHSGYIPGPAGIHAVDTTGAGDIFGGSAMCALLDTGKAPEDLTDEELKSICTFATTAASLSTLNPGGINSVPELNEVKKIIG